MTKGLKIIITMAVTILSIFIACFALIIYFAGQLSAVYPHLPDYDYSRTAKQLERDIIQLVESDDSLRYTITDSTGTEEKRNYYMTLDQKINNSSLSYHIVYSDEGESNCTLGLVGVFDKTHRSGGYREEDENVGALIELFEEQIIDNIK